MVGVRPGGGNSNLRFRRDRNTPNSPFMMTILDDDVPEPVEVIQVQVMCEDEENCYCPRSFYTITIIDNDQGGSCNLLRMCMCLRCDSVRDRTCTMWVVHLEGDIQRLHAVHVFSLCA